MTANERPNSSRALPQRLGAGISPLGLEYIAVAVVAIFALGLRAYHLAGNPLWLDEFYGYQLGQRGLAAIFENSLADPHPPLFYLLEWAAAGFGAFHNEWAWRWLVAAAGTATVVLSYWLARLQQAGRLAALLACTLFALCPTHIYFSQEARSPALTLCICTITTLLMWRIRERPQAARRWAAYVGMSLLGMYADYEYIFALGPQLFYLFVVLRLYRSTAFYGGMIGLCSLPLVYLGSRSIMGSPKIAAGDSIRAVQIMQSLLGGDFVRYGMHWTHTWLAGATCLLIVLGLWHAYRHGLLMSSSYYLLQIVLPLAVYFGFLAPVLHMQLPLSEAKNFIVLLPSLFVLAAQGIQFVGDVVWGSAKLGVPGRVLAGIALAVLLAGSAYASVLNLQRYWATPKSPEGLVALELRNRLQPGDAVITQHYSLDAALDFYLPNAELYTRPRANAGNYFFGQSTSILHIQPPYAATIPLDTVLAQHPRVWLLALAPGDSKLAKRLRQLCSPSQLEPRGPFVMQLLSDCAGGKS